MVNFNPSLQSWYYSQAYVQFELVKQLQNRYMGFATPNPNFDPSKPIGKLNKKTFMARYYMGYSKDLLQKSFNILHVQKKPCKIYFDLASLNQMQAFSYDSNKRREEIKQYTKFVFKERLKHFDFGIDIETESADPMDAYKVAKKVKVLLDDFKIPYSLKFSGSRGFHFYIPPEFSYGISNPLELPQIYYNVSQNIKAAMRIKKDNIDTSIYNLRMLFKLAYSIDGNNVALPLDDDQFSKFEPEMVTIQNVMHNVKIFKRGLLVRTHGLTDARLQENFKAFVDQYKNYEEQ